MTLSKCTFPPFNANMKCSNWFIFYVKCHCIDWNIFMKQHYQYMQAHFAQALTFLGPDYKHRLFDYFLHYNWHFVSQKLIPFWSQFVWTIYGAQKWSMLSVSLLRIKWHWIMNMHLYYINKVARRCATTININLPSC